MNHRLFLAGVLIAVIGLSGCATASKEQDIVGFAPLSVAAGDGQVVDSLTPLHRAARDGETTVVRKLLQQKANVNATSNVSGVTALILAATAGHEQIVDALLEAGAAPNTTDQYGSTALMYAASKGHAGIVNILLQRNADVNIQSPPDQLDSTALTLAAGNGYDAVLELLLPAGADIDWQTRRDGFSALMLAAELGQASAVNLLLSAGANPGLKDRKGKTACDLAAAGGHGAVTDILDVFAQMQGHGQRCQPAANRAPRRSAQ
jgi:ankyrin repeat protein